MGTLFFSYTILLIVVCVAACFSSIIGYRLTRQPSYVAAAVFFAAYFFDVCIIFQSDYEAQNLIYVLHDFYQIDNPIPSALMASFIYGCMWYVLCEILEKHNAVLQFVPPVILFALSVLVTSLMGDGRITQWIYFTLRQAGIFVALGYALYTYSKSEDQLYRRRLRRHKESFIALTVLTILIMIEDFYIIFIFDPMTEQHNFATLMALSERNFNENLMMIFIACLNIRSVFIVIEYHKDLNLSEIESSSTERKIEMILPDYAARWNLTKRETEVMRCILQNKTNQTIAAEFTVSEGTIKTHVHNILKKTNVEDRQALIKDFWGERSTYTQPYVSIPNSRKKKELKLP